MELFIRIKDGQPFEHPILGDNFRQAFPHVDTNNLPPEFARFVRIEPPTLGVYEKNQTVSYQLVDDVWTDVFSCEQMTQEERKEKQDLVKASPFALKFPSWSFNEEYCRFDPPVPRPLDNKSYTWDEATISWKLFTSPVSDSQSTE